MRTSKPQVACRTIARQSRCGRKGMTGSAETIMLGTGRGVSAKFTVRRLYEQDHRINLFDFDSIIDLVGLST
jgi:hypothetical protein